MRIVAIGAGAWGKNVIRHLYELAALAAFVEPDDQRRGEFTRQYPEATPLTDWQQALTPAYDAVAIATPTARHAEIAGAALQAGKDVYVEKPITPTSGEAQALTELAGQNGRILMVGHLLLYQPAVVWLRD